MRFALKMRCRGILLRLILKKDFRPVHFNLMGDRLAGTLATRIIQPSVSRSIKSYHNMLTWIPFISLYVLESNTLKIIICLQLTLVCFILCKQCRPVDYKAKYYSMFWQTAKKLSLVVLVPQKVLAALQIQNITLRYPRLPMTNRLTIASTET